MSTFLPFQEASHTPSFGGLGLGGLVANIETARRDVLDYNWQNHAAPAL